MKAARLVVLTVAIAAGGVAAMLAGRSEKPPEPKPDQQPQIASVDVILTRRGKDGVISEVQTSETVLKNIRVLAIDQSVEEKGGQKVVVGKTATLELTPGQAETLALSQQLGSLALALRSITDANS